MMCEARTNMPMQVAPGTAGIYVIENMVNGHCYIGASTRIGRRWQEHKYHLRQGNHHQPALQTAWNMYGESSFRFAILEEMNPTRLDWRQEDVWIGRYLADGKYLYNDLMT